MKDERIQVTMNHFAAIGFLFICYVWVPLSVLYRTMVLKQHPREFRDIVAIFFIGILLLGVGYVKASFVPILSKREYWIIGIVNFIVIFTLFWIMGLLQSVVDIGEMLIGYIVAMMLVIGMFHVLKRRWQRKEEIEDEE